MPAKRTSTTSQQPPLKRAKHASADRQPTLAFAARKGSSADAGKANKGKAAVKPDVVELDDDNINDEDDAALEALAELESGLPKRKSAPAGAGAAGASATAGKDSAELNPKAAKWNKPYKEALAALGGQAPIHCDGEARTLTILRVFDNDIRFGPSTSISRLARWERAHKWGLNPPPYVREILTTKQGKAEQALRETVFFARI